MASMSTHRYRERVFPGLGWIVVTVGVILMVAVAYSAALGTFIGSIVFIGGIVLAGVVGVRAAPVIIVGSDEITIGDLRLPRSAMGATRVLMGDQLDSVRRGQDPDIGVTAYTVQPPWSPRKAVVVEVIDDADPHSAWVISSRRPDVLEAAVLACRQGRA